ncbi:MAG: hypothetical protein AAB470_03140 [Patescibacteria group bacterium]
MAKLPAVSKFETSPTDNPNDSVASWVGPSGAKSYKVSIHQLNVDGRKTCIVDGAVVEKPGFIFKDIVGAKLLGRKQNYVIKITATDGKEEGGSMEFSLYFPALPAKIEDPMLKIQQTRQYMDLLSINKQTLDSINKLRSVDKSLADQFTIEHEEIEKIVLEKLQAKSLTMEDITVLFGRSQKLSGQVSDATLDTIVMNGGKTEQAPLVPKPEAKEEKPTSPVVLLPPVVDEVLPAREHVEEVPVKELPAKKVQLQESWWKKHGKSVRMVAILLTILVAIIGLITKWPEVKKYLTTKWVSVKTSARAVNPDQVVPAQEVAKVTKDIGNKGGVEKPLIIDLKNDNDRLTAENEQLRKSLQQQQVIPLTAVPVETNSQLEIIQMVKSIERLVGQHGSFSNLTSVGNINIGSGIQVNGNNNQVTLVSPNPSANTSLRVQQEPKKKCVYPTGWEPSRSINAPGLELQPNNEPVNVEINSSEVLEILFPDTRWKFWCHSPDSSVEAIAGNNAGFRDASLPSPATESGIWRVLVRAKSGYPKAVCDMKVIWNPQRN